MIFDAQNVVFEIRSSSLKTLFKGEPATSFIVKRRVTSKLASFVAQDAVPGDAATATCCENGVGTASVVEAQTAALSLGDEIPAADGVSSNGGSDSGGAGDGGGDAAAGDDPVMRVNRERLAEIYAAEERAAAAAAEEPAPATEEVDESGHRSAANRLLFDYSEDGALGQAVRNDTIPLLNKARRIKAHGQLAEAENLFRRALEGREKLLGPDHADTLQSLENLADLLRDRGRLDEAEPLFRRALASRENSLGTDDAATLKAVANLAKTLKQAKTFAEAGSLYARVASTLVAQHAGADGRVPNSASMDVRARIGEAKQQQAECARLAKRENRRNKAGGKGKKGKGKGKKKRR